MDNGLNDIETQFLGAAYHGDFAQLKRLLPLLKSIHIQDKEGMTPLWYAIIQNREDVVDFLMENGANINECDQHENTLLDGINTISMLKKAISYGLDIHRFEEKKESQLYFCVATGNIDIAKHLIELGVQYKHIDFTSIGQERHYKAILDYIVIFEEKECLEKNLKTEKEINKRQKI